MTDLYLKAPTKADMDAALLAAELVYGVDDILWPANGVLIDTIGPITKWDYSVEPPTETVYPEYYTNLRLLFEPPEDLADQLAVFAIDPNSPQYRVWA